MAASRFKCSLEKKSKRAVEQPSSSSAAWSPPSPKVKRGYLVLGACRATKRARLPSNMTLAEKTPAFLERIQDARVRQAFAEDCHLLVCRRCGTQYSVTDATELSPPNECPSCEGKGAMG